MSVGIAMKDKLLGEITDYEGIVLTAKEMSELENVVSDLDDFQVVEGQINKFLRKIGFDYNHDKNYWHREQQQEETIITVKLWSSEEDFYLLKTDASKEVALNLLETIREEVDMYSDESIVPYFQSKGYYAEEIPVRSIDVVASWN